MKIKKILVLVLMVALAGFVYGQNLYGVTEGGFYTSSSSGYLSVNGDMVYRCKEGDTRTVCQNIKMPVSEGAILVSEEINRHTVDLRASLNLTPREVVLVDTKVGDVYKGIVLNASDKITVPSGFRADLQRTSYISNSFLWYLYDIKGHKALCINVIE